MGAEPRLRYLRDAAMGGRTYSPTENVRAVVRSVRRCEDRGQHLSGTADAFLLLCLHGELTTV
jgi:hypothetical protein